MSQTYSNWELILLNDESPGNARDITNQFNDLRIRYLEHQNSGPAATRNRGMRESRGNYIAFIDSDDVSGSPKLEKQMTIFAQKPEVGVVYSQRITINDTGNAIQGYQPDLFDGTILNKLWIDNFVCMSSAVIKREVIDKIGYFDESLRMSEDYDYWLRVACEISFAAVDEPLVKYRNHCDQVSRKTATRIEIVMKIRERFDLNHGHLLSFKARRISKASILSNKAFRNEGKERKRVVLTDYVKSLLWYPSQGSSWRGIIRTLMPQFMTSAYRRLRNFQKQF